jgi:hypothetical protein
LNGGSGGIGTALPAVKRLFRCNMDDRSAAPR